MAEVAKITLTVLLVAASLMACSLACPPWTYSDGDGECRCGDDLGGVVHCDAQTLHVSVLYCNCMTYSKSNKTGVGSSLAMCFSNTSFRCSVYHQLEAVQNDEVDLNIENCSPFNRTGQLCGSCNDGLGLPVYSYSYACVDCPPSEFRNNLIKYVSVAFVPLTVFYVLVMVFGISITSASTVFFILFAQCSSAPFCVKWMLKGNERMFTMNFIIAFFSIWNLDFFRSVYEPFCLHPKLNAMHVVTLDYLIAVYPMCLIGLTYMAVTLHGRYPLLVTILRPVNSVLSHIRKEWNIPGSLIQAFVTFFVLSYVKVLQVSFELLTPVQVHAMDGSKSLYLFSDGEVPYFGREHWPYGLFAILMLTVFNILPVLILLVNPCPCFQRNVTSPVLKTFADAFQGCYRHRPRDCRYYCVVHFIFRILFLLLVAAMKYHMALPSIAPCFLGLTILVSLFKPYNKAIYNKLEAVFGLLSSLLLYVLFICDFYLKAYEPQLSGISISSPIVVTCITLFWICFFWYGVVAIGSQILPKKVLNKVVSRFSCLN